MFSKKAIFAFLSAALLLVSDEAAEANLRKVQVEMGFDRQTETTEGEISMTGRCTTSWEEAVSSGSHWEQIAREGIKLAPKYFERAAGQEIYNARLEFPTTIVDGYAISHTLNLKQPAAMIVEVSEADTNGINFRITAKEEDFNHLVGLNWNLIPAGARAMEGIVSFKPIGQLENRDLQAQLEALGHIHAASVKYEEGKEIIESRISASAYNENGEIITPTIIAFEDGFVVAVKVAADRMVYQVVYLSG